jgi:hypothetical protein
MHPQTTTPTPVSIANQRSLQGMARISHPLSPASIKNGSRWFAASDQAEKNRSVKENSVAVNTRANSRSKRAR